MAAPDLYTVAEALAACYASGTLTPPTGYPAVRRSTSERPNAITMFPFVTVELPDGVVGQGGVTGSTISEMTHNFLVRFWYAKHSADQARDMKALLKWIGPLLLATTGTHTELGLAGAQFVKSAVNERTYRFFVDAYGGAGGDYYGWELEIPVIVRDWPVA